MATKRRPLSPRAVACVLEEMVSLCEGPCLPRSLRKCADVMRKADFQRHMSLYQCEQRDQRVAGKVDMPDWHPRLIEGLAERLFGNAITRCVSRQGNPATAQREGYGKNLASSVRWRTDHPGMGRIIHVTSDAPRHRLACQPEASAGPAIMGFMQHTAARQQTRKEIPYGLTVSA